MKKIILLFALILTVGTASAAKLYATFAPSTGNYTYSGTTYSWTGSTSNLMEIFKFDQGQLADFNQLVFTFKDNNSQPVRINFVYGSGSSDNITVGYDGTTAKKGQAYYSEGTKTITISDVDALIKTETSNAKSIADVTAIRFGGNSNSGSCTIIANNVYLQNDKFAYYAEIKSPNNDGHYTAPTYTTTNSSNNLMTCFEVAEGELNKYDKLVISFVLVKGNVRVGYLVGNVFTKFQDYSTAGMKFLYVDPSTIPSGATKIAFGGNGSTDVEATIVNHNMVLMRDRVASDANFGTPGSGASYFAPTYTWESSTGNLMDVYNFSNGELANYETLEITTSNMSSGASWRAGYVASKYTNFNGSPYYSAGTKTVDLASHEIDMSTVTKIQVGGNSNNGSINVQEGSFVLKTRQFTVDQKSTVCLPYALTEEEATAAGVFYELTSVADGTLHFTKVTTTEANKPYVFVPAKEYPFAEVALTKTPVAGGAGSYTVNGYKFQGVSKKEDVPNGAYGYNATNGNFSKANSENVDIKARRAYIIAEGGAGARGFLDTEFNDGTTGIQEINVQSEDAADAPAYNLAGQRVNANHKGIIIKGGKKYIVK